MSHTQFPAAERVEDADTRRVAEDPDGVRDVVDGVGRHQRAPAGLGSSRVQVRRVTDIVDRQGGGSGRFREVGHLIV
jgi:hypothetical protein